MRYKRFEDLPVWRSSFNAVLAGATSEVSRTEGRY